MQLDTCVTSGLNGDEWPVSRPSRFTSIEYEAGRALEVVLGYGSTEEYFGCVKNRTVIPRSSVPYPSHSTDYATQDFPAKCYESKYLVVVVIVASIVVVVIVVAVVVV